MKKFKSGVYVSQGTYKSFQPTYLCKDWTIEDLKIISLLSEANRHLGRLDMYSEYVDIDMFLQMHIAKEATQSSKIEGTQTNIEEAFLKEGDISIERKNDWLEVHNYIEAMNEAVKLLHKLPFSSRLIRQAHRVLLQGVRGQHKQPGEFRKSQNWIGGASIKDAVFIPPIHNDVIDYMSDVEKFANQADDDIPELIKIALIHYQFETVHPFLDGNGRVGRLLITLYLVDKDVLKKPILYLSDFFERYKSLYYDNLMRVRTHGDMNQWLKFFLTGVIETAKKGVQTLDAIFQLQKDIDHRIESLGARATDARKVMDYLYKRPVMSVNEVMEIIEKTAPTAYSLIAELEKLEIIKEITGAQRNRLYIFSEYLNLFQTV